MQRVEGISNAPLHPRQLKHRHIKPEKVLIVQNNNVGGWQCKRPGDAAQTRLQATFQSDE